MIHEDKRIASLTVDLSGFKVSGRECQIINYLFSKWVLASCTKLSCD